MRQHTGVALKANPGIEPFSLKDAPALIERLWPAQKISIEAQKERKANAGQTLTALGSYWKGRKPLVLVRACVLAALLPATSDAEADLELFEKLMAFDDEAFLKRIRNFPPSEVATLAMTAGALNDAELPRFFKPRKIKEQEFEGLTADEQQAAVKDALAVRKLAYRSDVPQEDMDRVVRAAMAQLTYSEKAARSVRPEELSDDAFDDIWPDVNLRLGTDARSLSEFVEQLGIKRFGRRPCIGDTFAGAGSIPFEAARLGCDVYASDLNPIACMLTWGAFNLVGADATTRTVIVRSLSDMARAVDAEIAALGVEHDADGNRAKAYLYCIETTCPETGWSVPISSSWVISRNYRTCARLVPNHAAKRFEIEVITDATDEQMQAAAEGTLQKGHLVYALDGELHRIPIATIRGDYRKSDGGTGNKLRPWDMRDFMPRPDDVFRERLYCIQWIERESIGSGRPRTFFAAPTAADEARERRVEEIVRQNLTEWQQRGLVPSMEIEPGGETARLRRERGWTYWHHLFTPRHLLLGALLRDRIDRCQDASVSISAMIMFCQALNRMSKLTHWRVGFPGSASVAPSADAVEHVFYNQALNTFYNYGGRPFSNLSHFFRDIPDGEQLVGSAHIENCPAEHLAHGCDVFVTDPPYADAVNYHEITEYFISWCRRSPVFDGVGWIWDSRRALAIQGDGDDFRRGMVGAYRAMADQMPSNGLQIVMFTHQSGAVWADMAQIFWGAGLQVMAAWYIATETSSELKKGGYVQGTVILVLRKRTSTEAGYRDEIVHEVKAEVARQIETMVGLNQSLKGRTNSENLFEDADLQMAGYAAALRVLTGYARIDGIDMTQEALRPRRKGERSIVDDMIEFAVQVANEHLVPEGMDGRVWERMTPSERFYVKMLDIEETGAKKLDNYQNFAKALRVPDYNVMMGSITPNAARLKTAAEFKKAEFGQTEFGSSPLRAALYAIFELQKDVDGGQVMAHLRDLVEGYHQRRDDLAAIAAYIARKRERNHPNDAAAARVLATLIRNERLG